MYLTANAISKLVSNNIVRLARIPCEIEGDSCLVFGLVINITKLRKQAKKCIDSHLDTLFPQTVLDNTAVN